MLDSSEQDCAEPRLIIVHATSVHVFTDNRIFFKMCRSAVARNHDVHLLAQSCHDRDEEAEIDGVHVHLFARPKNRSHRVLLLGWRLFRHARMRPAHVYHIHDPELIPFFLILSFQGRRVIFDMHENLRVAASRAWIPRALRPLAGKLFNLMIDVSLRRFPVIFAETSYKSSFPSIKESVDILNYPDLRDFPRDPLAMPKETAIGYMGRLSEGRGILKILTALRILKDRGEGVRFDCIGNTALGSEQKKIDEKIESLGIGDLCRFLGYKTPQEGYKVLGSCMVGIAVLEPHENYVESYPTKLFEYMALGLPVVASNFPLYQRIVEGEACGLCVDPSRPEELADAVLFLVKNRTAAAEMGLRGMAAVRERYSWKHEFEKLDRFYSKQITGIHPAG